MFSNLFLPLKKGSVVLSLMASGAVAGAIVATHQIVQGFTSGAGQYLSKQKAIQIADKALALAAMMVNRNVILCSSKQDSNGNAEGCFVGLDPNAGLGDDAKGSSFFCPQGGACAEEKDFYLSLFDREGNIEPALIEKNKIVSDSDLSNNTKGFFERCDLQYEYDENGKGACPQGDESPNGQAVILRNAPSTSVFNGTEVTWSLRNWMDPNIQAVVNSQALTKGYVCQKAGTYEIIPDGVCGELSFAQSKDGSTTGGECKNSSNQAISGSVCNYFTSADFDERIVFITVKVEYHKSSDDAVTYTDVHGNEKALPKAKDFIFLNGLVRRPLPILAFSQKEQAVCAQRCEAAYAPSFGGGNSETPRCVGLSDYTGTVNCDTKPYPAECLASAYAGRGQVPKAENKFTVKNYGPGVLYDLRLRREDIHGDSYNYEAHQDKVILRQDFFEPENIAGAKKILSPGRSVELSDNSIPCYVNSYYKINTEKINCSCSLNSNSSAATGAEAKAFCAGTTGFTGFAASFSQDDAKRVRFSTDQTGNSDAIDRSFVDNRVGLPPDSALGRPILPIPGNDVLTKNSQPSACGVTGPLPNAPFAQATTAEPSNWLVQEGATLDQSRKFCAESWFLDMPFGGTQFCKD